MICTVIVFQVDELSVDDETNERIIPKLNRDEGISISIPREALERAGSQRRSARVRMASFLFRNMSGFLPESLEDDEENRFITYIIVIQDTMP